jgi:hypothetical protein
MLEAVYNQRSRSRSRSAASGVAGQQVRLEVLGLHLRAPPAAVRDGTVRVVV